MPSTPHLSQPPVDPPDPVSILDADPHCLPLYRQELLIPYSPHPARLYPLGELLGFCHVFLHVTRRTPPVPHLLDMCPREQVALADLSAHLVPGIRHGGA